MILNVKCPVERDIKRDFLVMWILEFCQYLWIFLYHLQISPKSEAGFATHSAILVAMSSPYQEWQDKTDQKVINSWHWVRTHLLCFFVVFCGISCLLDTLNCQSTYTVCMVLKNCWAYRWVYYLCILSFKVDKSFHPY